jgi:Siphovirus Gp157
MSTPLRVETHRYHVVRTRLLERWPELDAETLADTLEGITDLHEMIAAVIRSALVDEALQAGLRSRLEEMRQRLARLEVRGTKKRQLALDAMCDVGLKKVEQPDFTASARSGMSPLLVLADNLIPETYWVPQPPKLDRQTLLADLKRGEVIPGAELGNPQPCLAVRTK